MRNSTEAEALTSAAAAAAAAPAAAWTQATTNGEREGKGEAGVLLWGDEEVGGVIEVVVKKQARRQTSQAFLFN